MYFTVPMVSALEKFFAKMAATPKFQIMDSGIRTAFDASFFQGEVFKIGHYQFVPIGNDGDDGAPTYFVINQETMSTRSGNRKGMMELVPKHGEPGTLYQVAKLIFDGLKDEGDSVL